MTWLRSLNDARKLYVTKDRIMLVQVVRHLQERLSSPPAVQIIEKPVERVVEKIVERVEQGMPGEALHRVMTVRELSKELGVSYLSLHRRLKAEKWVEQGKARKSAGTWLVERGQRHEASGNSHRDMGPDGESDGSGGLSEHADKCMDDVGRVGVGRDLAGPGIALG